MRESGLGDKKTRIMARRFNGAGCNRPMRGRRVLEGMKGEIEAVFERLSRRGEACGGFVARDS